MQIDLIGVSEQPTARRPAAPALLALLCLAALPVAIAAALGVGHATSPARAAGPVARQVGPEAARAGFDEPAQPEAPAEPPRSDELELRLTSEDGRFQAFADRLDAGASIYEPGGRTQTTIEVLDQLTGATTTHSFARNLEPEAFSPDGKALYLIDHQPSEDPESYRVTGLTVASGELWEVLGPDKTALSEDMRGSGRQQVWSPDRTQLYTLYLRQYHDHDNDGHDHNGGGAVQQIGLPVAAFVHVLDVESGWAMCLDLPAGFGLGPAGSTAIMLTADGSVITVVDRYLGVRIDIRRLPGRGGFAIGEPVETTQS